MTVSARLDSRLMRRLRAQAFAVGLGLLRARSGGGRSLLVLVGVAAAAALLAAVLVGSAAAERRSLEQSIERLSPAERAVRAGWFGIPAQAEPYERLDRAARRSFGEVISRPPTRTVLFREKTIGGAYVSLGAVDGLGRWVRLASGHLPRTCTTSRCEVLQLRGGGRLPRGFAVVGRGTLRTSLLFGDGIPAERNELERASLAPALQDNRYHQPAAPPLLLAASVDDLSRLPELGSSYRAYGWVSALEPDDVDPWTVDAFSLGVARMRAALRGESFAFEGTAPTVELEAASERAGVGGRRLLLLGGQGAALLLAFAAFAAVRIRRETEEGSRRLTLLGVGPGSRLTTLLAQAGAVAVAGVVVVWALAALVVAAVDPELARRALLSTPALTGAALLAAAAGAAIAVAAVARPPALAGRLGVLDVVALALLLAIVAALVRGRADAERLLEEGESGVFLLALPAAVVIVAAIAAARLVAPLARAAERRVPPNAIAARLAAVSLARRPGVGAAATAFLVISVGLALFAATYGSTLERGQRDQAAFALGADFVLREDLRRLVPVRRVATDARLEALGPEVHAARVMRVAANVPSVGSLTGVSALGLEPELLRSLRGTELEPPDLSAPARLVGPVLPRAAASLAVSGRTSDPNVSLRAVVRRSDGEYVELPLAVPGRAALPAAARGGTLLGFRVVPPPRLQERGADAGRAVVAELDLGPVTAGSTTLVDGYEGWIGLGGATFGDGRLTATLTNQVDTWFRPRQQLDGVALPAVVSPSVAAVAGEAGRLTLQIRGHPVAVRVAAVAPRFPSTRGEFAVVDRDALAAVLDLAAPGSGFSTEVWANAETPAAAAAARATLARPPYDVLVLDSRQAREEELRADPVARGALAMLAVAAVGALLLALLAIVLATVADLRDDRDELVDLESQGASPELLRRLVRLRQLGTGILGLVAGVVAGAVLAALVVDVVAVSASAEPPLPPLELTFAPSFGAVALAAAATLAAVLVVVLVTRGAFASGQAGRPQELE